MVALPVILMRDHYRDIAHKAHREGRCCRNFIYFDGPRITIDSIPFYIVSIDNTNSADSQGENCRFNKANGFHTIFKKQIYVNFSVYMGTIEHREDKIRRIFCV